MSTEGAEVYEEIMRRVLAPAVTGRALQIEAPFGPKRAKLAALKVDAPGGTEADKEVRGLLSESSTAPNEVNEAVVRRIRALAPVDPSVLGVLIDGAIVELAAYFHDLIASFHPDLSGVFRRDAPRKLLEFTGDAIEQVPAPATAREALLRHAWLGALPRFRCTRTEVRYWVGGATFVGREPPSRLLAWPSVRRVRRDDRSVELLVLPELFGDGVDARLVELYVRGMSLFLGATPLTDLALSARISPPFRALPLHASLMANPTLARIAHRQQPYETDGTG